ncbi:phospholipase [Allostreptomyces psammosilenae]|uniref:Phospholipase A2 n=1 Tax=Allostreptomyces psammosilenae TaxID=1892865 RepID=A0A852ZTP2_9ACTN|nr:phospholipase [Allostreptomyces psammosilenae]NYI04144.1 hypothetical protein [Allostreptomyces psammosilenae]
MPALRRRLRARVAVALAALPLALVGLQAPAQAAPALPSDPRAATDVLLFQYTLGEFNTLRNSSSRPSNLIWSSDGCSYSPDAPFGYQMVRACYRHDFGYRNYTAQGRQTSENRRRIDDQFLEDMLTVCNGSATCNSTAYVYYGVVRALGWI